MSDLDLDAIRADHAAAAEERIPSGWTHEDRLAAEAAAGRCLDAHLPALLDAVGRVRAMCAFLADRPALGADSAADLVLAALENRAPVEADRV